MHTRLQPRFPSPESIVSVPITVGLRNLGIVSDCFQDGMPKVISNSPQAGGVAAESWHAFTHGKPLSVDRGIPYPESALILARARSRIGTPYDLLKWNCEHLVSFASGNAPKSPQVNATITLAALGLLLAGFRGA